MILDRKDVQSALRAFLDEYVQQGLTSEGASPDARAVLTEAGVTDLDASIILTWVHFDTDEDYQRALSRSSDNCRLICKTVQGGTDCFWACV